MLLPIDPVEVIMLAAIAHAVIMWRTVTALP